MVTETEDDFRQRDSIIWRAEGVCGTTRKQGAEALEAHYVLSQGVPECKGEESGE